MKIEVIVISKNKDRYIDEGVSDLLKKIKNHAEVQVLYLKETPIAHGDMQKILNEEGERILKLLKDGYFKVALDVVGKELSSEQFAKLIEKNRDERGGKIQFIIGGPLGLSASVLKICDISVSFSKMTFTHQIIRIMLLEQIYRGFEIIRGSEYHK